MNQVILEDLKELDTFGDLYTALNFASRYKSAKLYGVNAHEQVDATALLDIDCDDNEVQEMWRFFARELQKADVDGSRRRLEELQGLYRWMLQQANIFPKTFNS